MKCKKKRKTLLIFVFVSILGGFIYLFFWYNRTASPKIVYVAESQLQKFVDIVASDFQVFLNTNEEANTYLKITKNDQGEIVTVDYEMSEIYALASKLTEFLQNSLKDSSALAQELDLYVPSTSLNQMILSVPLGIVSDSPFLANLGPKVYVGVHFLDSVFTNVKTRITDYGINNALLEIYLQVTISYEIILPVTAHKETLEYELLIDAGLIQGKVPNWYANSFETQSAFLELPFA